MNVNLSTVQRLRRLWAVTSSMADGVYRRQFPHVIMISGAVDGKMLYSRPGSLKPTRYVSHATAERHAERLSRLYPGLRVRAMKRVSSAPLDATMRRHGRVLSW